MARADRRIRGRPGRLATLYTVGHGTISSAAFIEVLRGAGVEGIVDVRRFPGSRRHPQFSRGELERSLPEAGIAYRWDERLGGRRRSTADSPNIALRNQAFRAYADYMESAEFVSGFAQLLRDAQERRTAIMCSESLWWKCHRRLISDAALLLHDVPAVHLLHNGKVTAHEPTDGARIQGRRLVYNGGQTALL